MALERRGHDSAVELRDLQGYIAEGTVQDKSKAIDLRLREFQDLAYEDDINLLGLVRRGKRLPEALIVFAPCGPGQYR